VPAWSVTLTFLTRGPLLNALNLGQLTPLALPFLLLAERSLFRGRDLRAGLWLGLACALKMPPVLLVPWLALRRRWQAAAAAAGMLLAVVALSFLSGGWALMALYWDVVIRRNAQMVLAAHFNQSLRAALTRMLTHVDLQSFLPLAPPQAARVFEWLALAALLAALAPAVRRVPSQIGHRRLVLELGAVLTLALVTLPVSWTHYALLLLPVIAAIAAAILDAELSVRVKRGAVLFLASAVILINLPVPPPWVVAQLGHEQWFRAAISHQLAGTIALLALNLWTLRRVAT
jgi:hypothetical protein